MIGSYDQRMYTAAARQEPGILADLPPFGLPFNGCYHNIHLPIMNDFHPYQDADSCLQPTLHTPRYVPGINNEPWSTYQAHIYQDNQPIYSENQLALGQNGPVQTERLQAYTDQSVDDFQGGRPQDGDQQDASNRDVLPHGRQSNNASFLQKPADDTIDPLPSGDPVGPPEASDDGIAPDHMAEGTLAVKRKGGRDGKLDDQTREHAKITRQQKKSCWHCKQLRQTVWHRPF